jgi:gamma-glutamyltranspeptidase / glutathione hydrolase
VKTGGGIACGHPEVANAAEITLQKGGNAFDAVVAAQFSSCVVEPVLTSLGGGGYLLACPDSEQPLIYDFFVQTPKFKNMQNPDFYPVFADFGDVTQEFHIGLGSAATPGMVKGAVAIYEDLCTLPLPELMAPAIQQAREGVLITPMQAYVLDVVAPIYTATESARAAFLGSSGELPEENELFKRPDLADTLESLAREGEALFYEGEIAAAIESSCLAGGYLTRQDLSSYEVLRREPLSMKYRSAQLLTNPPPTFGGILISFALGLLESLSIETFGSDDHLQSLSHVMNFTHKARIDAMSGNGLNSDELLDPVLMETYRNQIAGQFGTSRGTTHISIADDRGNLAAMTLSNGEGCGAMVPGTGFMLNNMLGEEDINPGGVGTWMPDQRMASMMAPSILTKNGSKYVLGSGGSNRIRSAILQVVSNLVDFEMDLKTAINNPRIHLEKGELNLETGFDDHVVSTLAAGPHQLVRWKDQNLFFGGVHAVEVAGDMIQAYGDRRRGGIGIVV